MLDFNNTHMKSKHIKYSIAILAIMQLTVSCKKDFLELTPKGTATEENFYRNETEVYQGLIAVYDVMQWGTSGGYTMKQPLLSAASELKIDATPMEGFNAAQFNEILGFDKLGLNATVIATVGYRHDEDDAQHYKKVRKSHEELFITI